MVGVDGDGRGERGGEVRGMSTKGVAHAGFILSTPSLEKGGDDPRLYLPRLHPDARKADAWTQSSPGGGESSQSSFD